MPWLQVTLMTDKAQAPLVEAALESAGALAVTLTDAGDEAQLEPPPGATPLWRSVEVTALFEDTPEARGGAERLAGLLSDRLSAPPRYERLDDQPWERAWMDDFRPTRFGERLWVCPRGQAPDAENAADAVVVELDPGLAFGTGHHPTTALCLGWLDRTPLAGCTVTDYGCGSGILAIAALKLGAGRVVAVDHDPQALEATADNATRNGVADRLLVCAPDEVPGDPADLLVANILAGPLLELAPAFAGLVREGGRLALSGLLRDQAEPVTTAYRRWFEMQPPLSEEDWVLLAGRRKRED